MAFWLVLDIGREGRYGFASNVNILTKRTTTEPIGARIPHLLLRQGANGDLPAFDAFMHQVTMEATPISPATAREIARVIAPGGDVFLSNPDGDYARRVHSSVINELQRRGLNIRTTVTADDTGVIPIRNTRIHVVDPND